MRSLLCILLMVAATARAQDAPTFADIAERIRAVHRGGPVAESMVITATAADGRSRTSRVMVRVDAKVPRVSVRLGRALWVNAAGNQVWAVTPQNPGLCYVAELAADVTATSLEAVLPPIPVPQVVWGVGGDLVRGGDELLVPPLGWMRVSAIIEKDGVTQVLGATGAGPATVSVNFAGRLVRASGLMGTTVVEIVCEPSGLAEAAWAIDLTGRTRVASLRELKPAAGRAAPGDAAPALALMSPGLAAWSLTDAVRRVGENPVEAGTGPIVTALVMYRAGDGAEEAALLASGSLRAVKKDFDRRRLAGDAGLSRLLIVPVAVLEVGEVHAFPIADEARFWEAAGETLVITTRGPALLESLAPGAGAAVVMLDAEQIVLAVVPMEGAALDGLVEEARGVLREQSRR